MWLSRREFDGLNAEIARLRVREDALMRSIFALQNVPFQERVPPAAEPPKDPVPHGWARRRVWLEKKLRQPVAER